MDNCSCYVIILRPLQISADFETALSKSALICPLLASSGLNKNETGGLK